ncbi:hypothetical protein [Mariniluteicoccus flavus]
MGWGFIGDGLEAVGDGLQGAGDMLTGTGKALTGDFDGARESFGDAGGHFVDAGGNLVEATTGVTQFALAPGLYVAKEAWDSLGKMWDALEGVRNRVESWLDGLFNPLQWIFDKVKSVFSSIWDVCGSFIEKAREILRGFNAPETLQQAAQKWREGPSKAVAAMIPTVSQRSELAKSGWQDEAGRAYAARVPAQVQAVAETKVLCDTTATALEDTSKALLAYYTDCGGLVGRLYAATHGSPGSLFSLQGLNSIFGGGIMNLINTIKGMVKFASEMQRIQKGMAVAVTNSPAFPGGKWPVAQQGGGGTPPPTCQPPGSPTIQTAPYTPPPSTGQPDVVAV